MIEVEISSRAAVRADANARHTTAADMTPAQTLGTSLQHPSGLVRDYNVLSCKPSINQVPLQGNRSFDELGLEEATNLDIDALFRAI